MSEYKNGLPIIKEGCSGNLTLSPTAAGEVWAKEVLKPLLEELVQVVESCAMSVKVVDPENGSPYYILSMGKYIKDKAQEALPRLLKLIEELDRSG